MPKKTFSLQMFTYQEKKVYVFSFGKHAHKHTNTHTLGKKMEGDVLIAIVLFRWWVQDVSASFCLSVLSKLYPINIYYFCDQKSLYKERLLKTTLNEP